MTYAHALQYLSDESNLTASDPQRYASFCSLLNSHEPRFMTLLFAADRQSRAIAAYCRTALMAAGIHVGEVADEKTGPLIDTLRIDGAPVSPPALRDLCHIARREEQRLWKLPSSPSGEELSSVKESAEFSPVPPTRFTAAERCSAVFPRLFADAGCRVLLCIGDLHSPRLRNLAGRAPATTIAVLNGTLSPEVSSIPKGTSEVICPTCSHTVFRRVTDLCAHAGSRLTLTATSELTYQRRSPNAQTFSYRTLCNCTLRCGTAAALRAATVAVETLHALRRLGCNIRDEEICRGLSVTTLPMTFSPLSIHPLVIADCIEEEPDIDALLQAISDFDAALPHPRHLILDPALPESVCHRLHSVIDDLLTPSALPQKKDADTLSGTMLLVGSSAFLHTHIAPWSHGLRPL